MEMSRRLKSTLAVNLASIIERADEQVLPAMYSFVGESFNAKPETLGFLTFCRALTQALCSPIGGLLGYRQDRTYVIAAGCLIWGLMTFLFGFTRTVAQGAVLWAFNGIGLSLVIPSIQSLTADYFSADTRGKAFGALYFTSALGGMLGTLYATNMGGTTILGHSGWRFVFFSVGVYSMLVGLANLVLASDPRKGGVSRGSVTDEVAAPPRSERMDWAGMWASVRSVLTIPTFVVIVIQGVFGSFPWQALAYMIHYLQLCGMSKFAASTVFSLFLFSTAIGGVIGGVLGDYFGEKYPNHGRIFTCQFSVGIKLPFVVVLMKFLPRNGELLTVIGYGLVFSIMGTLAPWAAAACNNPIFAEIVPKSRRNLIYAFDRSFEGALAALGAPLVGWLAEKFGYQGNVRVTGDPNVDLPNAEALGDALFFWLMVPWFICLMLYCTLHWSYPRDKQNGYVRLSSIEGGK